MKELRHLFSLSLLCLVFGCPQWAHSQAETADTGKGNNPFERYKLIRLDSTVNSKGFEELSPHVTADGKRLYFVRSGHPDNIGGAHAGQDIWYSDLDTEDSSWSTAKNLGPPINNKSENALAGFSKDGKTLYLSNDYSNKRQMRPGLSVSHQNEDGSWSYPEQLDVEDLEIKHGYFGAYVHPSEDVILLYMKSDKSMGREDIYVTFNEGNNKWSEPLNLGPDVNSRQPDFAPFLSEDKKKLYFSSFGHTEQSQGSGDIFMCKRLDDSWTRWSRPVSLSSRLNGPNLDHYFSKGAGEGAFLVKGDQYGEPGDIYYARPMTDEEWEEAQKKKQKEEEAKDTASSEPVASNKEEAKTPPKESADDEKPPKIKKDELHRPEGPGGWPEAAPELVPGTANNDRVKHADFPNVEYDFGKHFIRQDARVTLENMVDFLKKNPEYSVELVGHTDSIDTDIFNLTLSGQRAHAAKRFAVRRGIDPGKINILGFGELMPIDDNGDPEGRQRNRRVEIYLVVPENKDFDGPQSKTPTAVEE